MSSGGTTDLARRLWSSVPARWLLWIGAATVLVWAAVWLVTSGRREAEIVRSDPDAIPAQARLMDFAVARGAGVFKARCADCHSADGKGNVAQGAPDLTDADWL